jgi:4-carboxymuconolactone decarboxylase
MIDRMPPLDPTQMDDAQRSAAAALIAGPRKAVIGPFIALLRSPVLMDRLQRVGEYLRFENTISGKLNELAILATARHVTNEFEWAVHYPLAAKAGIDIETLEALARGRRVASTPPDEALLLDFCQELLATHHVDDATYARALARWGEKGVVDLVGTVGYFVSVCLVMNMAGTPAPSTHAPPMA